MQSICRQIDQLPHPLNRILQVARSLLENRAFNASTSEWIAAAFVLERLDYLPQGVGVMEAWEHLDIEWQFYARHLRQEYRQVIESLEESAADRERR